jgi:uncharacterized protein YkuJ
MNLFDLRLIQDQSIYNMDNLDKADFHALTKYAIFHNTDNMDIYHLLLIIFAHIKCKDLIRTLYENYIKDLDVQGRSMIFNESIDTVCKYSIRKRGHHCTYICSSCSKHCQYLHYVLSSFVKWWNKSAHHLSDTVYCRSCFIKMVCIFDDVDLIGLTIYNVYHFS